MRSGIALVLVALWLGGAILTAASVAPSAFAVLPTRALAGDMVGRVLDVVFISGIVIGAAVALFAGRPPSRLALGALMALACAHAQFVLGPKIAKARADIDLVVGGDARRAAFGRLHALSVASLGVAMLAAALFLTLSLLALRGQRIPEISSHG